MTSNFTPSRRVKVRPVSARERVKRRPVVALTDPEAALRHLRARVKISDAGCWEWAGFVGPNGYASCSYRNRYYMAHRLAAIASFGPFDPLLQVCHRCDNRRCCNPDHLFIGTRQDNVRDSVVKKRHHLSRKTHCTRGHELSGDNLARYTSDCGGVRRVCKICELGRMRRRAGWPDAEAFSAPIQRLRRARFSVSAVQEKS